MSKAPINSNVAFVREDDLIHDAVRVMVERAISSVLVLSAGGEVVGIVTERDIVRKVTLLEVSDKLTYRVKTIMSRPVYVARLDHLRDDAVTLHAKYGIRHFPIVDRPGPARREAIVGMVSVTDLARVALLEETGAKRIREAARTLVEVGERRDLAVLAADDETAKLYQTLFGALGHRVRHVKDLGQHLLSTQKDAPLVFDLDGWPTAKLRDLLIAARASGAPLLLTTSDPRLLTGLKQHLAGPHQEVAIKPIDVSYCHWVLTHRIAAPTTAA